MGRVEFIKGLFILLCGGSLYIGLGFFFSWKLEVRFGEGRGRVGVFG